MVPLTGSVSLVQVDLLTPNTLQLKYIILH